MARSRTTYLGINRSSTPIVDPWDADDDHLDLYNKLDAISRGIATRDSNSGNRVVADDAKAGMFLSAQGDAVRGRVVGIATNDDAFLVLVDNDGATLTDKFAVGYDDSVGSLSICAGAALTGSGLVFNSTGDVTLASTQAVTVLQISNDTTSGDPLLQFALSEVPTWTMGADDSDADKLKIEYASTLGGAAPAVAVLSNGQIGLGTTSPDLSLHVHVSSAGAVTADGTYGGMVVESAGHTGVHILALTNYVSCVVFGDPNDNNSGMIRYENDVDAMDLWSNGVERMRLNSAGSVLIGTTTAAVSGGTRALLFGDNATDAVPGANIAGIYAKDVGGTVEMFAVGEDGVNTQISPHDPETGEYVLASVNLYTGIQSRGLIEQALKDLSVLTGKQYWVETSLPIEQRLDWDTVQAEHVKCRDEETARWDEMEKTGIDSGPRPEPYVAKQSPVYIAAAIAARSVPLEGEKL